ncbi:uncharacterized protein LOC106666488 isoform X2 [Cimex lectularius]|uniref:SH2 domain-containing adapter protein D n=1 Tax=Cimex lectularius TaxID=79782 RepID=A0A8I6TKW9_CIMLE|nr:uncharacterized protein LOC106666488 isoform X2 [Cimex lectularius]
MERLLKRVKPGKSETSKSEYAEDELKKFIGPGHLIELNPRFIKRRFCCRKSKDNELYRSNSFKFERFDKSDSAADLTQIAKQVSLCDDYSFPVDFVNKSRPLSIGSSIAWDKSSPHLENVEFVEFYCDPQDSKAYLEPGVDVSTKLYTTPDKEYSHPYSTDCLSEVEEAEVYEDVGEDKNGLAQANPYYCNNHTSDRSEDRMSPRLDEMSRRHQYETAFDSKISKSDDELDVDEVTNKSIIVACRNEHREEPYYKRPRSLATVEPESLSKEIDRLHLDVRPFVAPTPPSSAPLPSKFHSGICIGPVHSSPDLSIRTKDLRLPIKTTKHRPRSCFVDKDDTRRFCDREQGNSKSKMRGLEIREIKGRPPRRIKYSSTESMATSSSGGSLESIRSSTSEGNRSTSSCESRHSSTLSSYSSDSTGSCSGFHPTVNSLSTRVFQQTKFNILSPISDKSSQEPCSETSENNKNNNSEKASPEEIVEAHQGSDSGISIESRIGNINPSDLSDLPFDMPKLRRRRMLQEQAQDTSGSATSVDLGDLPFDMPKLRRRLRPALSINLEGSQKSNNTLQECKNPSIKRPSLSLDLQDVGDKKLSFGLPDLPVCRPPDQIDTSLPLEQQGWYHGAITRLEAENILRMNREGSFLVRNSESTKQDYSLSLKSARGFMHMRIQKCKETGKFILGQFSNPFMSIPEMIKFYSIDRLPIRGAEHMCLSHPIIVQLL